MIIFDRMFIRMTMKKTLSRKEKVLKTALQMVAAGGFQNAPISEIASKAKVAVGTIYHHFASKEMMIDAMFIYCKKNLSDALISGLEGKGNTRKKYDKIWENFVSYHGTNSSEVTFLAQFSSSSVISASAQKEGEKMDKGIVDFINEGIKSKDLGKHDAAIAADFLFGAMIAASRYAGKSKKNSKEINQFRDLTWSALKK